MGKDKEELVKTHTVEEEIDSNEPSTEKRRSIIKGALLGTGSAIALPDAWVNPIINTVIIPSHAQTTTAPATTAPATTAPATTAPATTVPATTVPATTVPATSDQPA